ncbi:MAG: TMEM43 family protein [bacterium]
MPEVYTEVKKTGWGQNIVKSIIGVLVGAIMFIVSFVVLWNSEGRVNLGTIAEKAIVVDHGSFQASAEGKLVAVTGPVTTAELLGDPEYLKPGKYIMLDRIVEMYAWIEETETETKKKTGGGTEEKTTYRYKKTWTSNPQESSEFKIPEGHENPSMPVKPKTFYVDETKIGIYSFDHKTATLPSSENIELNRNIAIAHWDAMLIGSDYIFMGSGSYENPRIGDLRISFKAVHAGIKVTLFGKLDDKKIVAYFHKGKTRLYRAFTGTKDEAIVQLKTEHKVMAWILRIVGFLLMWIGLSLVFGPISAILDVLPFLGNVGRGLIGVITFVVALILSVITILISMIFHNTIALILLVIIAIVVIYLLIGRKKKTAKA